MQDSLSLHAGRHTLGGLWGVGMRACVIYAACVGRVASFATAAAVTPTQTIIAGHRALLVGPMRTDVPSRPPLVLLGGTAQWLDSWQGHLTALAQSRRVLLYETRGQGGAFAAASEPTSPPAPGRLSTITVWPRVREMPSPTSLDVRS